jgi:hypothetical protein
MRAIKDTAKGALRWYGVATSSLRCLPDFLIIGAKRAGSTSLWNAVVGHPSVLPMFPERLKLKGTGFLSVNFDKGIGWYRSHFALRASRALVARRHGVMPVVGEATPYYLFHPLAPSRAKQVVPDAKLIVILRNPIDRAYSHYRERVRHNAEPLSFEEALDAEEERTAGEEARLRADPSYYSYPHEHQTYVRQGCYAESLERWFEHFGPDRFLVILTERFDRQPDLELERVWAFLGIPNWQPRQVARFNYHPSEGMRPETRDRLREIFRPHNRRLEELLGVDLSGWDE